LNRDPFAQTTSKLKFLAKIAFNIKIVLNATNIHTIKAFKRLSELILLKYKTTISAYK